MKPCLTVGVTTHNERYNIINLLDRLLMLPKDRIRIILYDDGSTDGTATLIAEHPLSRQANFQAQLADVNFGSPSVGRRFIAEHAASPYITFVDGDDLIDPKALAAAAERLRPGFDIFMTPFVLGDRTTFVKQFDNARPISNTTISRLLSGIAGKIYNREAVFLHAKDEVKGRSEDVRLNMRILLAGYDRVRIEKTKPFYYIAASRKSTYAKNILPHELSARVANYRILKERYGLDDTYLKTLHRNLLEVIQKDPSLTEAERVMRRRTINEAMAFQLKEVIHVMESLASFSALSKATRDLIGTAVNREIRHTWIALQDDGTHPALKIIQQPSDEQASSAFLGGCHFAEAVVIIHDDSIKRFPISIKSRLLRLPLVQMRWLPLISAHRKTQAAPDWEPIEACAASWIACTTSQDIALYKQLGIAELTGIKRPVQVRSSNTYDVRTNEHLSYVVSGDFSPEEADFLVEFAKALKEQELPPLHVFVVGDQQKPALDEFAAKLSHVGVLDSVNVKGGITDRQAIYDKAHILIAPSFGSHIGDLILDAFSFGVPVIAPSYVPGSVEIVRDGEDGFLLDEFSVQAITMLLDRLSSEDYATLSRTCFARHREFSVEQYLTSTETIASDVARRFPGENSLPIIDGLNILDALGSESASPLPVIRSYTRRKVFRLRGKAVRVLIFLRVAEPLRWIKNKMKLVLQ